jgi:4-diphosphocytidyl-2-C-methyl-D-erythritol kinase
MGEAGSAFVQAARAKVNLSLRVLRRRDDGYHELESLVAFAADGDRLTFAPAQTLSLDIDGPYAAACGDTRSNLVLKAAAALAAQVDDTRLQLGRFVLTKNLPVASGIGGGSADAAAALRLLAAANGITADDPRLRVAAAMVGADVPVCLASRARMMRGIGELLGPELDFGSLPAVLVNPGVALATKDVFKALCVNERAGAGDNVPTTHATLIAWLAKQGNDLEAPAVSLLPVVADMLASLRALAGCQLARMSGSGATCFGLFDGVPAAQAAAARLSEKQPAWWVRATTLS